MVSPASDDPRRLSEFPEHVVDCLITMTSRGIRPRDIVTPAVAPQRPGRGDRHGRLDQRGVAQRRDRAGGGHRPLGRRPQPGRVQRPRPAPAGAGEHAALRRVLHGRRRGQRGAAGHRQGAARRGLLRWDRARHARARRWPSRCGGSTRRRRTRTSSTRSTSRSRTRAGCACCGATSRPTAVRSSRSPASKGASRTASSPGGPASSTASVPSWRRSSAAPESFGDNDMVVIRYEGPRGAPGMPELLDPTSRITALCRERGITIALMTDARFSGGSVGLVIGHVAPEAFLGGPIALVEDGDTIVDRRDERPHRLPPTRRAGRAGAARRHLADQDRGQPRRPSRRRAGHGPGAGPDAGDGAAGPPRWGHGHTTPGLSEAAAEGPAGGTGSPEMVRAPGRGC